MTNPPENPVICHKQKEVQDGLLVLFLWLVKQNANSDELPSQTGALAFTVKNAVRNANHHGQSLEIGIMGGDLADAHEEVFDALDVDAHDLWDEFSDLLLQSARNVMTMEGVHDDVHPCNTLVNERVFKFETDSSTERKQEKRAQFANEFRVVLAKVLLEELLLSLSLKPLDDSIFIFAFGHSLTDAVKHTVIFLFRRRFLNWGRESSR